MIDNPDPEARAAYVIAELLATNLLKACDESRSFLYCWEQDAIDWLREWQKRTSGGVINYWTASYLRGEIQGAPRG